MVFKDLAKDFWKKLQEVDLSRIWTKDHRIPLKHSNQKDYQALNSTLIQQKLNSIPMLLLTEVSGDEFNQILEPNIYNYSNFISYSVFKFHFYYSFCQSPRLP